MFTSFFISKNVFKILSGKNISKLSIKDAGQVLFAELTGKEHLLTSQFIITKPQHFDFDPVKAPNDGPYQPICR